MLSGGMKKGWPQIKKQPPDVFYKKKCSNFAKFKRKHPTRKHQASAYKFIKRDSGAGVFQWILWKIFKGTFFTEHLWTTASVNLWNQPAFTKIAEQKIIKICNKSKSLSASNTRKYLNWQQSVKQTQTCITCFLEFHNNFHNHGLCVLWQSQG